MISLESVLFELSTGIKSIQEELFLVRQRREKLSERTFYIKRDPSPQAHGGPNDGSSRYTEPFDLSTYKHVTIVLDASSVSASLALSLEIRNPSGQWCPLIGWKDQDVSADPRQAIALSNVCLGLMRVRAVTTTDNLFQGVQVIART